MVTFKEYLVEYATKQNSLFYGITKLKAGKNGKLLHSNNRKHVNSQKKEYTHKHPIVDSICRGKTNNVQVAGKRLLNILALYGVQFASGSVVLGNSCVEARLWKDQRNHYRGILSNRKKGNGLQS
jgi:hypothetical protein